LLKFESKEDWMEKTNLFFSTGIDIQNFVESIGESKNKNFDDEINATYKYIEIGKVLLKLKLNMELTGDFKNRIDDAIKSKDPKRLEKIIEEYGQLIPTEIVLG